MQASGSDNTQPARTEAEAQFRSRMILIGIMSIFAIPLMLATFWLHEVRTSDTPLGDTSRGDLIRPAVPLKPFEFNTDAEEAFTEETLRGIWTLLYVPTGECEEVCKRNLYHMRQVRLALNQRMTRVQRAVVVESNNQLSDHLISEHPGLHLLRGNSDQQLVLSRQVRDAEKAMPAVDDALYLIDPLGNLMMRFDPDLPPKSLLKDLKHLLKVSRIG